MKKSLVALSIITCCGSAVAQPYIGVELFKANTSTDNNEYKNIDVDGQNLSLGDDSEGGNRLFAGYQFDNRFGIEFGYTQFGREAEKEKQLSYLQEEEWNASLDIEQLELLLTYTLPLNTDFKVQLAGGMVWHKADLSYGHQYDNENAPDKTLSSGGQSENAQGVSARLALQYQVLDSFTLSGGYQYSTSDIIDSSALFAGIQYQF
ncbi:AcfA family outer membrane beta-barrel protein [Marinomonas algarum]|uniref:AcfA family outer membrane beta-barrel protein n=1 Tax=Marinomonas algarum TaxID=2883105 RepID=A0A9X1IP65_9GAMM|nr:AcfA family outer membrane beta-barrel protein [Marinomonas algarum]MCB5161916.1 AcfA family outer membrane beta-barrel protein [Marinomonas algarum]